MERRLSRRSLLALPLAASLARVATAAQRQPSPTPADVPMFRGNPARTGEHPGPGPAGQPILAWALQLGYFLTSSPSVAGGLIYIGSLSPTTVAGGALHAVDAATGIERWRLSTAPGDGIFSSPAVVDGTVVVGTYDGILIAADAATGAERWRFQAESIFYSTPVIAVGVVHVGDAGGHLYALDVEDGTERWRFAAGPEYDHAINSPSVAEGVVYCVRLARRAGDLAVLHAFEASTGTERWSYTPGDGNNLRGVAVVVGDRLYVPTLESAIHVVDRASGQLAMRIDVGITTRTELAVAGGVAYVGAEDGSLHAMDVATGQHRWATTLTEGVPMESAPAVADGMVYLGDAAGVMHAVDAASGDEVWKGDVGSLRSAPAVTGGFLYVGGNDGGLRAVGGDAEVVPAG